MNKLLYQKIIDDALKEDLGMGDLTTDSVFDNNIRSYGTFTAKADGVLAGLSVLMIVYEALDGDVSVKLLKKDGDPVKKGDKIARVEGTTRALLSGERVILNLIQHMSGIATSTNTIVSKLSDESISIADTRKTLPGLRTLQKYAVTCGGGKNHRFRLDDGVMIKDNHITAAGSISEAIRLVRKNIGHMVKIEVETENKDQVKEAIDSNADVIMLDNRTPDEVKEFVSMIPDGIIVEVSGGITPDNISDYKGCGADIISLGWLTHSVKALDISFNLD